MKSEKFTLSIVLCVMAFTFTVTANAQSMVSGTVTDENDQPVVGVTVLVVGTVNGAQTNFEGKWTLQVDDPQKATIQFSCLGYQSVEERVRNRAVIDVTMSEDQEELEEIVVVGYGTQKKVNLTGAVSSLNMSDLGENRTIMTTAAALAGLVPGMMVQETTSQPGNEATTLRIRGTGSFTSSASSPLILVDGVEWGINNINPNDIESISVLKDAASTAIYGTRAANGVILITTKTGDKSKARLSYSFKGVFQNPYNNFEWVSDYADYMELVNEACDNSNQARTFSQSNIDLWREKSADPNGLNEYGVPNYMAYPNTDWFDAIFSTGFSQEHNISISGGGNKVRYMISGSYLDNTGIMTGWDTVNSTSQKATFRTNLEADINKWLTVGTKLYGQFLAYGTTSVSTIFTDLASTSPGIWPGSPQKWGQIANNEDSPNSNNLLSAASGTGGTRHTWRLNGTVYLKIHPYKGISIEGSVNYSPTFRLNHTYGVQGGKWDYYTNTAATTASTAENSTVTDYTYRNYYVNTEILARYDNTFKKNHTLGVLLGYSTNDYLTWNYQVQMKGGADWSLTDGSTFADLYNSSYSARSGWRLRSYFARVNYSFKDRYLFEANVRVDGSSVFGSNKRYGVFPSFSAGWKLHEEPWMDSASNWLSELKLRASWGQTGNNQGIGNYSWQATYAAGGVVRDGSNSTTLYIDSLSNADLKWETTSTTDIGLDLGFFDRRLTAEIDYYYKGTKDILYTPSSYLTMGFFNAVASNLGNMWNQGVELALNWKSTAGRGFYYYVGVNFSFNKNKVTNFKGKLVEEFVDGVYTSNWSNVAESWNGGVLIEGHPIGEHHIYKLYSGNGKGYSGGEVNINNGPKDGMIRTESDLAWVQAMIDSGYTFRGGNTLSKTQLWYGDFIYADLNGNGDYGDSYDCYFTGHSSIPSYNLGITLGFSWKGLDFSMIWSGAFDYYLNWRDTYYNTSTAGIGHSISKRIANDHYFYDSDNPDDPRTNLTGAYPRLTTSGLNNLASDFYEYKSDYMKLKNVTVGYTLPEKLTRKFFVQQLRFFVSGENILTITSYPGMDPEIGTSIGYPLMRQYTVGAQITF